uniref:CSON015424 protein n=1 Tax=Culicoides sonorensis TaxID=179676 RepID=A0A336K6C0_CULSO
MAPELTVEQKQFLESCENNFKDRFTDKDQEFKKHSDRSVNPPPIVDDWMNRQSNNYNNSRRYNNFNNRERNSNGGRR